MATQTACRRKTRRHSLPKSIKAEVEFGYPYPDSSRTALPIKDISNAGLSFRMTRKLAKLEVGCSLDGATIRIGDRTILADLFVMHVTGSATDGATCGALIYPVEDEDVLMWREVVAEYDSESQPARSRN